MNMIAKFERIGRNHNVPDLAVSGSAEDVAEQVYRYARRFLASRDVEVVADLEDMKGNIYAGMHNGGSFTLEAAS